MDRVLVIDDDPAIRTTIRDVLSTNRLEVQTAGDSQGGLDLIRRSHPHVLLLDVRLGTESGLKFFQDLKEVAPQVITIFITGHGTSNLAIETMKMGAFDYLCKPLDLDQLNEVIHRALKISKSQVVGEKFDPAILASKNLQIVGSGQAMQAIYKQMGRIAPQHINVLILGESGTGKELVAHSIVQHSKRYNQPFLAINCAAIPESLLESELFGHEQGTFTGADRKRIGKFEQCNGGTIFLDEVGDMSLATQSKMLRLLQEGQFQRVGGNETITADVRILAATNQDLESLIQAGRFRRDLYYRLKGVALTIPPLRDRKEDIPELSHYFLYRLNRELGTDVRSIAPDAIEKMQEYHWPGNIRELLGAIREAMILSVGPTLLADFLSVEIAAHDRKADQKTSHLLSMQPTDWDALGVQVREWIQHEPGNVYRLALFQFERLVIGQTLQKTDGFLGRTAEVLGISRPTLRSKLRAILKNQGIAESEDDL